MKPFSLLLACIVAFLIAYFGLAALNPNKLTVFLVLVGVPLLLVAARTVGAIFGLLR